MVTIAAVIGGTLAIVIATAEILLWREQRTLRVEQLSLERRALAIRAEMKALAERVSRL